MMVFSESVDKRVFRAALAIVHQARATAIVQERMTATRGRPRSYDYRTVFVLLAITALERGGRMLLTEACQVQQRLSRKQRERIGLVEPLEYDIIQQSITALDEAFEETVDTQTGEVLPPRMGDFTLADFLTSLAGDIIPSQIPRTTSAAIDSTDIETSYRRQSWTPRKSGKKARPGDGRPEADVEPGGLPESVEDMVVAGARGIPLTCPGGWVTMPPNGWTMLAQEEVRAMTTTTGTDLAPRLRAFKHRLDPNPAQATLLAQYAGAARVAYNMLTAHNRAALAAGAARRTELAETGLAGPELAARMKAERAADPTLRVASYQSYSTAHLTPLIRRHREAAAAIAAGADPAEAWTDERYVEPWMHTVPRRVLVSGLQNAAKATENWMASASGTRAGARVGLPRFKKKGRSRDSFTIPAPEVIGAAGTPYKRGEPRRGVITDHRHLRLASLGTIRTYDKTSRLVRACRRGAQIRSMTISQAGGRWYASILVADPTPIRTGPSRRQRANGAVGVDLGVKHLAALSTGEVIDNGRPGARQAARLTRLQRAYARTQPGSNRRERVRRQIAALQHGIALRRAGLLHQVSTRLATDFAVVALEDLNVAGMTRSARGTLEAPGRNVAAKSGLNRAILDAGLGMLRRQLDYKTSWAGSQVKMIDRFAPSSKACSRCGTVKSTLSLAERTFECEACHLVIDRDVNAAINIRAWAVQEERGAGVELARGRRESRNGRGAAVSGPPSGGAAGQGRGSVKPAPQGVGMSSRATGWSSQPPSTEGESAERGASALAR